MTLVNVLLTLMGIGGCILLGHLLGRGVMGLGLIMVGWAMWVMFDNAMATVAGWMIWASGLILILIATKEFQESGGWT